MIRKFEKVTIVDFAKEMDAFLTKNKGRFVDVDDILEYMAKKCIFGEESMNEVEKTKNEVDKGKVLYYIRLEYRDIIKKSKEALKKSLNAYGLNFETEGGKFRGQKFRYPEGLDFSPYQSWLNKEWKNVEAQSVDYKYSKAVEGRIRQCLNEKRVVEFDIIPSYEKSSFCHVVLHPHYIKVYNGRRFVLGYSNIRYYRKGNSIKTYENGIFPFDRIITGTVNPVESEIFIESNIDYTTFFDDIIGVTHYEDKNGNPYPLELITIKTLSAYAHGRMKTRPLHKSQEEKKEFSDGYGLITLNVKYNKELLGALFGFESGVEVISPKYIRELFKKESLLLSQLYDNDTVNVTELQNF